MNEETIDPNARYAVVTATFAGSGAMGDREKHLEGINVVEFPEGSLAGRTSADIRRLAIAEIEENLGSRFVEERIAVDVRFAVAEPERYANLFVMEVEDGRLLETYSVTAAFVMSDERATITLKAKSYEDACEKAIAKIDDGEVDTDTETYDAGPTFVYAVAKGDCEPFLTKDGPADVPDGYDEFDVLQKGVVQRRTLDEVLGLVHELAAFATLGSDIERPAIEAKVRRAETLLASLPAYGRRHRPVATPSSPEGPTAGAPATAGDGAGKPVVADAETISGRIPEEASNADAPTGTSDMERADVVHDPATRRRPARPAAGGRVSVTLPQLKALRAIAEGDGGSAFDEPGVLAMHRLPFRSVDLYRMVNRLLEKGLVTRSRTDNADQASFLYLTDLGREVVAANA